MSEGNIASGNPAEVAGIVSEVVEISSGSSQQVNPTPHGSDSCLQSLGRENNSADRTSRLHTLSRDSTEANDHPCLPPRGHGQFISGPREHVGDGFYRHHEYDYYDSHEFRGRPLTMFRPYPQSVPPPVSRLEARDNGFSDQQMATLRGLLQDTLKDIKGGRESRSRSRSRHRSRKRRYRSPSSSSGSSSASSRSRSPAASHEAPDSSVDSPGRKKTSVPVDADAISVRADDDLAADIQVTESEKVGKDDEPKQPLSLANPHEQKKGTLFDEAILDWWKQQRTHVLEQSKKDEILENLKPDPSVDSISRPQICLSLSEVP